MAQDRRLTALRVEKIREPGRYADGRGLLLQVTRGPTGNISKSWLFRFERDGKERRMGLGSLTDVSLAQAREAADECRKLHRTGIDPIEHRKGVRVQAALDTAKTMTFDQCRDGYIAAHCAGWRNVKHASQWTNTLATYVTPVFGKLPVQTIDVALVMKVIEPIWSAKPETASRVRGRIEVILDWARVRGYRMGENPARWRGHLDHLLPPRSKVRKVKHHAALPYADLPAFMNALRDREAVAARALEFLILTASRTGEVLGATHDEIDFGAKAWTVPAARMKGGREHRVPLSDAAVALVKRMRAVRQNDFIFAGDRRDMLSNMAMLMLLDRMGRGDITAHGFRATFKTWASERAHFPREVVEAALAHVSGNKVEAAYQRGDLFDKRRRLMTAWTEFCSKAPVFSAGVVSADEFLKRSRGKR